ncbi:MULTISPECIES: sensor histidine kinase [Methylosinus]|uniref:histidine kinase n=1 Tax=Methylosinus trichosporium (strain ATCC 35070 / NCIMB 11131 / UNIQEM 75 / OB3b) TaxID=595536 RepID=A0A2D2D2Z2_METT3|nr:MULTISPECIES: HAMP domain-containing sensor histidine kinase [Methylosinus]ATQ69357.1 sensor histidine kinase [Methylosinus trichosporium OB3b]OBS52873.1 two-component sensor histidine kinase [Methylosinus sp. 3S-1]
MSLARRIVIYLVAAQLLAFLLGWVMTLGLGMAGVELFATTWDELAKARAEKQVVASVARAADGAIVLAPTPELQAEQRRAPDMKIAAFDMQKRPLAGSSAELVAVLRHLIGISPTHVHFVLPGDESSTPLGLMEPKWTPYGRIHIAVYGQKFRWDDLIDAWQREFRWLNIYVVMAVSLSTATAWFAMRRGMRPLHAVAREAELIDMDSLHQRLTSSLVPTEITPLVRAMNEALERLDLGTARQRRFTANAAHELRTPVAVLTARLDAPEEASFKSDLKRDAHRIKYIVEQLLATLRAGEQPALLAERVDLGAVTRAVVDDAALLAIRDDKQIEFIGAPAPVEVRGNGAAIAAVVGNLIDNALRAEPENGEIVVRIGEDATVSVADHGPGIPESERLMIFEPFWRKNEATPGAGLGLAIAKDLVEKHRGRIWVEETPGGGATFKLSFPHPAAG